MMIEPFPGLAGSVSVVTGGGSSADPVDLEYPGTGTAISVALARSGSRVVVLDRSTAAAKLTVEIIEDHGGESLAIECDVTDPESVRDAIGVAVDSYGRLDSLVNNVGIMAGGKAVTEVPDDEWDRIFAVNVRGNVYAARHATEFMESGSSIVNISSTTAGRPHKNRGAYPISKGAINSLTTSLAVDLGFAGIRVNGIAPGSIWTPLGQRVLLADGGDPNDVRDRRARDTTLLQQVGTAWDVAYTACFLCSHTSRWITGQTLTVDGGGSVLWGSNPPQLTTKDEN